MPVSPEHFKRQSYPPEVRGYISGMEELMREPEYNHAGTPTQLAIDLWRAGCISSFAQFEGCLRDMGSRVHFLAVPLDYFGDQYVTVYPGGVAEGEPEHTLYAAVNGSEEAQQMLTHLGITAEENVTYLAHTGVITLPSREA
jgi:hypothetical protein